MSPSTSAPAAAITAGDVERWVRGHVEAHVGSHDVDWGPGLDLARLGLDSRERLELVVALEDWSGVAIDARLLAQAETLGQLCAQVVRAVGPGDGCGPAAAAQAGGAGDHATAMTPFERFVNPALGRRLRLLRFDVDFVCSDGTALFDAAGRRYLDFVAGYGSVPFGHNPAAIWAALDDLRRAGTPNLVQPSALGPAGALAERLIALAPGQMTHVTFANSGAEAIEAAIKLCRVRTGRPGILSTAGGFHGKTLGALSATGNAKYQVGFGAPAPGFEVVPYGDIAALARRLAQDAAGIAAFVVEPIQGEGGIVPAPEGYLAAARRLCRQAGVLFVVDEVQTGLGRTGALFASAAEVPDPDVIVLAKALGGGVVPIGACLASAAAYSEEFALKHSSTFAGNAVACTAGLASLDLLVRDNGALVARVAALGAAFLDRLRAVQRKHPAQIKEVRGRGLMIGVELTVPPQRSGCASSVLELAQEQEFHAALVASGMLRVFAIRVAPTLNGSAVLRFEPPLTVSEAECDQAAQALDATLALIEGADGGRLLRSILESRPAPPSGCLPAPAKKRRAPLAAVARPDPMQPAARPCAFIAHPLQSRDYAHFDPSLGDLSPAQLEHFQAAASEIFSPFVADRFNLVSRAGQPASVDVIMLPQIPTELTALPESEAVQLVQAAVDLALRRGARTIGLGGYSSIVTRNGALLRCGDATLTTGNGYTVISSIEALDLALHRLGRQWAGLSGMVIGAGGSVGRGAARMLAERTGRLILAGNPLRPNDRPRQVAAAASLLRQMASDGEAATSWRHSVARWVRDHWPGLGASDATSMGPNDDELVRSAESAGKLLLGPFSPQLLAFADVVIAATSSSTTLVEPGYLRRGAIVCDISRPANVSPTLSKRRPDVLVFDGGLIRCPGGVRLRRLGLPDGFMYACMAETLLLGLAGAHGRFGAEPVMTPAYLNQLRAAAATHGFELATLRAFGRTIPSARWRRLGRRDTAAAQPSLSA